jgi:hypothetical protein
MRNRVLLPLERTAAAKLSFPRSSPRRSSALTGPPQVLPQSRRARSVLAHGDGDGDGSARKRIRRLRFLSLKADYGREG